MIRDQFMLLGAPNKDNWPEVTTMRGYGAINFAAFPRKSKLREKFPKMGVGGRHGLSPAGFDLLSRLLCINPARRITASEALDHPWFRCVTCDCVQCRDTSFTQGAAIGQGQGYDAHISGDQ